MRTGVRKSSDGRFSIVKQVKAAPQFRLGTSHRTAEPTEFARFHEIMRDFESSQKKSIAPLFGAMALKFAFYTTIHGKNGLFAYFRVTRGCHYQKK